MNAEWREYKVGGICSIKHGFAFKGEYFCNQQTNYIVTTPGNFSLSGGFKLDKPKYYNGPVPDDFILGTGAIIVTMTDLSKEGDTLGFSALVPYSKEYTFLHNQRIGLIENISPEIDRMFLYWMMRTPFYQRYVANHSSGSTVRHSSPSNIGRFKFSAPFIEKQREIASILSSYDELIENNNRRIKILEQMAENLYKEWFVRFRFPGHEQAEFENGIPKGWEVKHIGDICKIITGKKDANEATGDGDFPFFTCARETNVYTNEYFLDANAIIISGNGSYTGFVKKYAGKFDLYQRTYALYDFQNIGWLYVYWFMKIGFEREFMGGSRGSAIPYITKPNIEKYKILIPAKKELKLAEAFFASIHNECLYLEKTNRNLTRQRDLLLPRLMSGKLEV